MALVSGYSIALPVFSAVAVPASDGDAYRPQGEVCGSAFALGGDYMLTAQHVLAEASAGGDEVVVGLQTDGFLKAARVVESEQLHAEIALLRVEFVVEGSDKWFNRLRWREGPLHTFEAVRVLGYAYGIHRVDNRESLVVRGFEGRVVSGLREFKPVGWPGLPFPVYELSFLAPRGLSGAPLLSSGTEFVHGVVIGNSQSRMLVFRSEERVREGDAAATVEQHEAMTLGIAVQASTVLAQTSRLLGKSIREHLADHALLG